MRSQCKLWDKALSLRIAVQKGFGTADRLPGAAARQRALETVPDIEVAYDGASAACRDAITELLDVMDTLLARNAGSDGAHPPGEASVDELGASAAAGKRKRGRSDGSSVDALSQDIADVEARFAPFRDGAVDRWHRKAMLATGHAAMRSQLHALNQSLSQQVAAQTRDAPRALARVQRDATAMPPVLCESMPAAPEANANKQNAPQADGTVAGTFDDTSFYAVLLQEYLQAAGIDIAGVAAAKVLKKRKAADRRASKGRKIKYTVMDKLVNFMVPQDQQRDKDVSALFSNLFGRGVHADEQ